MAFQKNIELRSGETGNYIKITHFEYRFTTKECFIHFGLYKSQQHRTNAPDAPLKAVVGKMRLTGPKFDQYFSTTAMQGKNHLQQAYIAAKQEGTISDFNQYGKSLFGDAQDV